MEYKPKTLNNFSHNDLFDSCPIIKLLFDRVGIQNFKQIIGLCVSIFIPLLLLSIVTSIENRFSYGSVKVPLEKYGNILGMSFLGDTMVWPYAIIVPITFLILKYTIYTSTKLLNRICQKATNEWKVDKKSGFDVTITKTKQIFKQKTGYKGLFLKIAPWLIALLFWTYNTATCAFHDYIGKSYYPYKTERVVVIKNSKIIPSALKENTKFPATVLLEHQINLPKWDCDLLNAPLSTITTRVWTFFYYGLPPFILCRLVVLIWGVSYFLSALAQWEDKQKKQAIKIELFGEDGFSGLSYIADTGMSYLYLIVSFIMLLTMSFFKEGPEHSWHNYLLLFAFVPIAFLSFMTPTVIIRQPMIRSKENHLQAIVGEINQISNQILCIEDNDNNIATNRDPSLQSDRLNSLKILYDHVKGIPEWPFTYTTYLQICLSIGIPIGMIIIDKIIDKLIK